MYFLVLKNLMFSHVNCHTSFNLHAGPAITAHVGFAQNICLKFGAKFKGCAILHQGLHIESTWVYGKMHTHQIRGTKVDPFGEEAKGGSIALSDQPNAFGHYQMSMIIAFESNNNVLVQSAKSIQQDLVHWLSGAKFAGGSLVNIGELSDCIMPVCYSLPEAMSALYYEFGFWITDASDKVSMLQGNGFNQLEAALKLIYDKDQNSENWHSLSSVGYYLAHQPRQNIIGARRAQKLDSINGGEYEVPEHAFAEPLLGLIEYTNKYKIKDKLESLFWHFHKSSEDPNALICVANKIPTNIDHVSDEAEEEYLDF